MLIANETEADGFAKSPCRLESTDIATVWHGDNAVNRLDSRSQLVSYSSSQCLAHLPAAIVDTNAINDTVGPGQVDIFKDVRII